VTTPHLADRFPVPGWLGLPPGSYHRAFGFGTAFVHADGTAYDYVDPNGRRVRVVKAPPAPPEEPVAVDPRELLYREPRSFEEFQAKLRLQEIEIMAGRMAPPAPRPVVEERTYGLDDDPAWQEFTAAARAWLASPEYEEQRDRVAADFDRAAKDERARLAAIARTDGTRARRAARELEELDRIIERRSVQHRGLHR